MQPSLDRRRLKILLIRSESGSSSCVSQYLVDAGHLVCEATCGDDAARILRNRPVNLVLFEGCRDSVALVDLAASIRGTSGRVSARYTPIFVVADRPPLARTWPAYIDAILPWPFSNEALITAYLEFLSSSLSDMKRPTRLGPCCEIDAAIDRLGGDVELYKDLVDRLLDDSAGIRGRVESAIETCNAQLLHHAAHSLKGLAASVGAVAVANALADLEELGRVGDFGPVAEAAQRLRIEMERAADELADYHSQNSITPALRPKA